MEHELWYLRHESGREMTIVSMPDDKLKEMMQLGYVEISFDGYQYIPIEEYLEPEDYKINPKYSLKRSYLFRPETLRTLQLIKMNSAKYFGTQKELTYHEIIDLAINQLAQKVELPDE